MGILSTVNKAKNAIQGSALWKQAKNIAGQVKNIGMKVVEGIIGSKDKPGIIQKAYGKLKSWGSMALGAVFPDMDDETLTSLQSVTSSSIEAGGPQFAGTFGNSLKAAGKGVVAADETITGRIKTGLMGIHEDIKTAATGIYENTVEFITGDPKTQAKVSDPGQWVADKAKAGTSSAVVSKAAKPYGFVTSDAIYDPASKLSVADVIGKPAIPMDLTKQPLNVQYKTAEDLAKLKDKAGKPLYDMDVLNTSREMGISPFAGVATDIKEKGIIGSGATQKDILGAGFGAEPIIMTGDKSVLYKNKSLLDKARGFLTEYGSNIGDALGTGFGTFGDLSQPYVAGRGTSASNLNAQRQGVGGRGSAGGDFLSQAQAAFINKQRSDLERLG